MPIKFGWPGFHFQQRASPFGRSRIPIDSLKRSDEGDFAIHEIHRLGTYAHDKGWGKILRGILAPRALSDGYTVLAFCVKRKTCFRPRFIAGGSALSRRPFGSCTRIESNFAHVGGYFAD